jgi:hypothetical protein
MFFDKGVLATMVLASGEGGFVSARGVTGVSVVGLREIRDD